MTDALTEWLKTNEPTRELVTYWRRNQNPRRDGAGHYHRCSADGVVWCACGRRSVAAGSLGPVERHVKRPVLACNISRMQSARGRNGKSE